MELALLVIAVALAGLAFFIRRRRGKPERVPSLNSIGGDFREPIPKGYRIFAEPYVAGLKNYRAAAEHFARSRGQKLRLEREPTNPHDPNAVRLIGETGDGASYMIGYVPRETASQIVQTGLFDRILPRLRRIYFDGETLSIRYDLLGPRGDKALFDGHLDSLDPTDVQIEYLGFFQIPFLPTITRGEAVALIENHEQASTPEQQAEWAGFRTIVESFDDRDFRELHEIGNIKREVLYSVIGVLLSEGFTYAHLGKNPDVIVEKIIDVHPELDKSP